MSCKTEKGVVTVEHFDDVSSRRVCCARVRDLPFGGFRLPYRIGEFKGAARASFRFEY
jgi:hypothetical protein